MAAKAPPLCPECAARRGEADDWRRLYQGLARAIVAAGAAGQPIASVVLPATPARPGAKT